MLPLLGYAVLTAAMDVYAGNRFTTVSPSSIAAVSFTATMLFFLVLQLGRGGLAGAGEHRRDLVAINVTTAVTWLATLYALDYLEPAIVNVLGLALGPVITVVAGGVFRRSSTVLATEVTVSLMICLLLGGLVWASFTGRSGLVDVTAADALTGLGLTLVCAVGSSVNIIYMKRLADSGCASGTVLGTRFFLMTAVAWGLVVVDGDSRLGQAWVPGLVVAVIGLALPITVLQIGIKHTEPITTSLVISLSPLFAFVMQLADGRLQFSPFTLLGIVGVVALVGIGAAVRDRADHRAPVVDATIEPHRVRTTDMLCAIVDAYGAGRLLPAALRRRGGECVHVRSPFPDTRLRYRPQDFTVDIRCDGDVEDTAARLRGLGVTDVVAAAESGVLLADQLADALGVAGNAFDRTTARRDKHAMQAAVRAAGLATARDLRSSSVDEVLTWAEGHGNWPVVLKPVLSAGTDNVIICGSRDEVVDAYSQIMRSVDRYGRRNGVVLAQEYLRGAEHYVNTVSRAGRHRVIEVWRYHKTLIEGRSVYDYEDLVAVDEPGVRSVVDYVRNVLDALGIANGAAHTEVMLTAAGPYLIESGARLGGGQMPDLLARCVGTDQVDSLAFSIVDPESFLAEAEAPYLLKSHLRCVNLISPSTGVMPPDEGWSQVRELSSFAALVPNHPPHTPLTRTVDMATCPGTVYLSTDDAAALEADYDTLRELEATGLYGPR